MSVGNLKAVVDALDARGMAVKEEEIWVGEQSGHNSFSVELWFDIEQDVSAYALVHFYLKAGNTETSNTESGAFFVPTVGNYGEAPIEIDSHNGYMECVDIRFTSITSTKSTVNVNGYFPYISVYKIVGYKII